MRPGSAEYLLVENERWDHGGRRGSRGEGWIVRYTQISVKIASDVCTHRTLASAASLAGASLVQLPEARKAARGIAT